MARLSLVFAFCLAFPQAALSASTCELSFRFEVTQGVGLIRPGTEMGGWAAFSTGATLQQEGGSVGHIATGMMSVDGDISGRVWTLITASRDHASDFVGVYATDVTGFSFAGVDFTRLKLLLFGDPGVIGAAELPRTQSGWDALTTRRTVILESHDGSDMLSGNVTELQANCY